MLNIGSVLTSLQTGAIDSFAAPPVAALTLQWYARVKYITDLPLLYTYGLLAIDKRYFDRLSEGDQKIMREVLGNTFTQLDQEGREQNREAFKAVQQQGLETVTPSDEQRTEWKSAADKATQSLVSDGELSSGMLDRLHRLLDDYRAR